MPARTSIEIIANATDALNKLNGVDKRLDEIKAKASSGFKLMSSVETKNVEGEITRIVDTYRNAVGQVERYTLAVKESGEATFSVSEKTQAEVGKIATAFDNASVSSSKMVKSTIAMLDAMSKRVDILNEKTSMFGQISATAFAKYSRGNMSASEAMGSISSSNVNLVTDSNTTANMQRYVASFESAYQAQSKLNAETSMFGQISDQAFAQYSTGALSAQNAMTQLTAVEQESVQAQARKIIASQKYYNTLNGVTRAQSQLNAETSMFGQMGDATFKAYSSGLISADQAAEALNSEISLIEPNSRRSLLGVMALSQMVYAAFYAVVGALRSAFTEMKNIDTQLVDVRKVTDASAAELEVFKQRAYEVGKAYGIVASDYLSAVAAMSRAGYREQAGDLAELSSKLQLVGNVSEEVANQLLISVDKAYDLQGSYEKLSVVIDQLNEVDNKFATSIEKVAEGMGIIAPVASQAHMSIEELVAAVGTITATTQRSGSEAARALRSLVLNIIGDTKTEIEDGVTWTVDEINDLHDVLKKYSPEAVRAAQATGEVIDPMEAIGGLAQSMKDGLLTEQELFAMVSKLGGKLRSSQLMALIQNWDMYNDMLDKTANALGSADKEVENALDSWQVKLNQLKNTFTEFVANSLSSDFVKKILDDASSLLEAFGSIGNVLTVIGVAIVALKLPSVITYFTNLTQIVQRAGGGFGNLLLSMRNYNALSPMLAKNSALVSVAFDKMSASQRTAQLTSIGLTAAVTAIIAVISLAVIGFQKYAQSLDETIEKGKRAFDELAAIKDIEEEYRNLKEQYEDGKISQEEYAKGKGDVIKKLQDEGVAVEELSDKYNTLEAQIDVAIRESKKYKQIEVNDAFKALEKKANGFWTWNAVGYQMETAWAGHYLYGDANPLIMYKPGGYSLEEIVDLYDKAIKRREEIYDKRKKGITLYEKEDERLREFIENAEELVTEYKELAAARDQLNKKDEDSSSSTENLISTAEEGTKAVKGLSDELKTATDALNKYNEALKGGEKGDTFKSYADAYKKAVEMYEKGLTGSKAYMSAIDLLFDSNIVNSYEEAGKLLGNKFIKAMFEGGGEDFGANAANYIRENIDDFKGVAIKEANDGTFSLMVTDMDAFAESANVSKETLWALMEALDGFSSTELDGTQKTLDELEENKHDIEFDSNLKEFEEEAKNTFEDLDGTVINVKFHGSLDYNTFGGGGGGGKFSQVKQHEATGTKNAVGGATLVNEEGAELIYANGSAWIAGNGQPVITNLPHGAGVFNAKDTRAILTRSGIPSFKMGLDPTWQYEDQQTAVATAERIKKPDKGKPNKTNISLKSLLDEISKYVDKILKKAKEALQEQLDAIDEQIDKLKREHDAEEDANKLEELRLKILEAEKKLAEAENERTVRYFNKETGQWEWMADQKAVADAQKALQEAQEAYDKEVAEQAYQAQLQALEDQKDSLNAAYDDLEDRWSKILEALQESENGSGTTDIAKLLASLGKIAGGATSSDIQKILDELAAFTANPTSALDAETTARIMSVNGTTGGATSVLSAMLGSGSYDLNGRGQSTLGGNTSIVGDTIYYINGVQIGSDMMDKPLSQILSVLPIYAN